MITFLALGCQLYFILDLEHQNQILDMRHLSDYCHKLLANANVVIDVNIMVAVE